MNSIITLTTDFGLTSAYVATMKGVNLKINREATVVDVSHTVEPQNVLQVINSIYEFFPLRST